MHGSMMMSSNNGGSGGGSDGDQSGPKRKSSGSANHKCIMNGAPSVPLPVVLAKGTFLKFGVLIFGSLLITISGVLAFYWKHHYESTTHMKDGTIHLTSGERAKLETKAEAKASRKRIVKIINTHVDLKMREVKVEQKAQIQKLGDELKQQQRQDLRKILSEVKQTRRVVRSAPPR